MLFDSGIKLQQVFMKYMSENMAPTGVCFSIHDNLVTNEIHG